ncbi:MAG TPA: ester cyclase [Pseudolabrys sp.]|nr:ester cyclase [Pseudolabrys sp.]
MSTLDDNKKLYLRLADEVLSKKNLAVVDELIAEDFVEHVGGQPRRVGTEGFKAARTRRNLAFPDWKVTVDDVLAEGDKVVARARGQGTHRGEYMGIPPTGKVVTVGWIAIYRVANGKLAEHWQHIDELGLRQQLGATLTVTAG